MIGRRALAIISHLDDLRISIDSPSAETRTISTVNHEIRDPRVREKSARCVQSLDVHARSITRSPSARAAQAYKRYRCDTPFFRVGENVKSLSGTYETATYYCCMHPTR